MRGQSAAKPHVQGQVAESAGSLALLAAHKQTQTRKSAEKAALVQLPLPLERRQVVYAVVYVQYCVRSAALTPSSSFVEVARLPSIRLVLGESSRSYEERSTQHAVIVLAMDPSYGDCPTIIPNALESTPPGRQQSYLSRIREAVSRQVGDCVPDTNVLTTQGTDRCDVIHSDLTQSETQHKCEGAQLIDEKNERDEPTQC